MCIHHLDFDNDRFCRLGVKYVRKIKQDMNTRYSHCNTCAQHTQYEITVIYRKKRISMVVGKLTYTEANEWLDGVADMYKNEN